MDHEKLKTLYSWKSCQKCEILAENRQAVLLGRCPASSILTPSEIEKHQGKMGRIFFVATKPHEEEDDLRKTFVGSAEYALTALSERANLRIEACFYSYLVSCRTPDNRVPNKKEITNCNDRLLQEIFFVEPELIVALGSKPLKALTRRSGLDIKKVRGEIYDTVFEYEGRVVTLPVMALLQPETVWKSPDSSASGQFTLTVGDLQQAQQIVDALAYMRGEHGNQ